MAFLSVNSEDISEKILEFKQEHEAEINSIQKSHPIIRYLIAEGQDYPFFFEENGKEQGIYHDIIDYVQEMLDVKFELVEENDYQSAIELLEKNEIQILAGIPYITGQEISKEIGKESLNIEFSNQIGISRMILAAREADIEYTVESIPYFYWGSEERFLLLSNKENSLKGHVISYNRFEELVNAIQENEIQGLLIKERNFDYLVDNLLSEVPVKVLTMPYTLEERLAFSKENSELNHLMNQILDLYLDENSVESFLEEHKAERKITIFEEGMKSEKGLVITGISVVILIGFILLLQLILKRNRKSRMFHELEQRLDVCNDLTSELFYIDLGQGRIYAKRHFITFELPGKHSSLKISELNLVTGYDYTTHYKNILIKAKENFVEEYDMYMNGEKYHLEEQGVFCGCYFVTCVRKRRA